MNHSKIPLRLATMLGLASAGLSLVAAVTYLVMKLVFWYDLPIGIAPIIIGMFFVASVQLLFLGVLGEYIEELSVSEGHSPTHNGTVKKNIKSV